MSAYHGVLRILGFIGVSNFLLAWAFQPYLHCARGYFDSGDHCIASFSDPSRKSLMSHVPHNIMVSQATKRDLNMRVEHVTWQPPVVHLTDPGCKVLAITSDRDSYFKRKPSQTPVPWDEVITKVSHKVSWEALNDKYDVLDGMNLTMAVKSLSDLSEISQSSSVPPVLLLVGLRDISDAKTLSDISLLASKAKVVSVYDCQPEIQKLTSFGAYDPALPEWQNK